MPSKILIVDDNKSLVEVLQMDFELRGHKVLCAYDGEEGERAIREERPEIVILDVMMPNKNGYAVCRDVKRDPELSKIPIVLLTAKSTKDDIYWGYDCGADAYVTKPYESRELIKLVEQLLKDYKEGKRSFAWTGLADGAVVEKEAELRKEAGGESLLISLEYDEEPKETFLQKYGTGKFRDMIHSLAWKLYTAIQDVSKTALLGQYADDTFVLLINPKEEAGMKEKVLSVSDEIISSFYDSEDRKNRGILKRDLKSGTEILIPFMSLNWKKN
ncbi:MAG: response regulator transcription factor [Acidobacteriota bacterium]|nr:response regulator [Thermoanaerobaculaceae bacterium]